MKLTESKLREIIREMISEDFAGPLSKSQQKKFESNRKKNSEVLGYKLTGTTDRKTEIGLTEAKMVQLKMPVSDRKKVVHILLKQLKLKIGKDFEYGGDKGANFIIELDKRLYNKVLDLLLKSNVRVHG